MRWAGSPLTFAACTSFIIRYKSRFQGHDRSGTICQGWHSRLDERGVGPLYRSRRSGPSGATAPVIVSQIKLVNSPKSASGACVTNALSECDSAELYER